MSDSFSDRLAETLERVARNDGDEGDGAAIRLARRLGIGGFFRNRIAGSSRESLDSAERTLRALRESLVKEAAEELSHTLTARDVPHFFFKGVAVADRFYASGEREMDDIDVHVRPSARDAVRETLVELGYEIPPDEQQEGPASLRSGIVAYRRVGASNIEHVSVDVAWGLDPVDRLLPRPDRAVPEEVWNRLDLTGSLPVPNDAHHVVLIVHHLVHHDMLHLRGLVDLALIWPGIPGALVDEMDLLAKRLGVLRALRLVAAVLQSELGVIVAASSPPPDDWRSRRLRRMLNPDAWCTWASNAAANEFVEINASRIRRRMLLLDDLRAAPGLAMDAILPPREYLRWRWPEARSIPHALAHHLMRVAGKLA